MLRDYDKCSESHFFSVEEMDPDPTSSPCSLSQTVMLPRGSLRVLLSLKQWIRVLLAHCVSFPPRSWMEMS